jgi:hypothetical protein
MPPFYTQGATLREARSPIVPRPSTVTSKTPAEPLRVRAASPPSSDVFGIRCLSRTGPSEGKCWGEDEDATLRSRPSSTRCTNGGKMTGAAHPSSSSLQDEGARRSLSIPRPHPTWRPTWDSAHYNRPRMDKHVTGLICNSFSVMTVCNPPLWEYSGDNPGAWGHKRSCIGTLGTRTPINTPVHCP